MGNGKFLAAALLAAFPLPASASVIVVGSSSARLCYEAADSAAMPSRRDLTLCDAAFAEPSISHSDTVATYVNRGIVKLRRGAVTRYRRFDSAIAIDPRQPDLPEPAPHCCSATIRGARCLSSRSLSNTKPSGRQWPISAGRSPTRISAI